MLLRDVCLAYLDDRADKVRPNTLDGYRSSILGHLIPDLGDVSIEDLTSSRIQEWLLSFPTRGVAVRSYSSLRQVVRWSIRRYDLRIWDPTTVSYEMPRSQRYVPVVLGRDDTLRLIEGIKGQTWELTVALGALCGLRRCEACGLMWQDIDLETGWTRIARGRHDIHGEVVDMPPKTEMSARLVIVPGFYLPRVRELARPEGYLCELSPAAIARKYKAFCLEHELPYVPMKNLRHTWATQALERGVSIEEIMMYLGHTNIDTSYEHYLRRTDTLVERISAKFEQ